MTAATKSSPPAKPASSGTARSRLLADRWFRRFVTAGGLAIIASILGILIFILLEVIPLLRGARVERVAEVAASGKPAAVVTDEYRTRVASLGLDGQILFSTFEGEPIRTVPLFGPSPTDAPPPRLLAARRNNDGTWLSASTEDGRVLARSLTWDVSFEGQVRKVEARLGDPQSFIVDPAGGPVEVFSFAAGTEGAAVAALLADGSLNLVRRLSQTNFMTGEVTASMEESRWPAPRKPTVLVMDPLMQNLYGGTAEGELLWWDLTAPAAEPEVVSAGSAAVTALGMLVGYRSLVVGQADGGLSVWFPVRAGESLATLTRIREFPPLPGAVTALSPSLRNKGFLAAGGGQVGLYYSTSERVLWRGSTGSEPIDALALSPRADGAVLASAGRRQVLAIDNPHPEVSWRALTGKVWYEGYEKPEYSWQSTGGTDDFESKLSLTPLLLGTLKGTLYSLLLALPLGILGAMYTSQFLHPAYQRWVKPTVEIMAALPTVVLGFLAGLWLAPRIEKVFPSLLVMGLLLPLAVLAAGALYHQLPKTLRGRLPSGTEALGFVFVVAAAMWAAVKLSPPVEGWLFGGNFPAWLLAATGMTYDQRNAVVVGLAMGFAVIPIIFAISEDAFSNVPKNLISGSLALGANRWQTVTRVVLPTASPGIFSAVMVGFGRAVGETMIVLMATGNTPIMDWSPFNGFRTLSANIAVEIPEAPHGSTLYRTLFLAALLLFILTFAVNTVAELVRQRLRQRYSQL